LVYRTALSDLNLESDQSKGLSLYERSSPCENIVGSQKILKKIFGPPCLSELDSESDQPKWLSLYEEQPLQKYCRVTEKF